ncbi:NfeD family protein [Salinibaculum rarum]|jgi:membrane protein implicated in regulation of membrane protease activity|uniref:NfeD family protein n=1 Tax=Salinibaculum rarum TaxID=3058903 RepID=UPI0026603077|nr:NfeD family protein [Salinibaculum sp. KK48]
MAAELFGLPLALLLLLAGAGLVVAEAFAPGAHFFVLGVGLFAAGLVGVALPSGLGALALLIMAAAVIIATGLTLYVYREFDIYAGSGKGTTSDSSSLRGQTGRVTERVTPTDGEVKLESGGFNPYYKARSVDGTIEKGETVIVVDPGGGNVITVESFADRTDDIDRELARERERTERETESESSS